MKRRPLYLLSLLLLLMAVTDVLHAQKSVYDSLLTKRVKVENPVYKPVIGIGGGAFAFLGDIKGPYWQMFNNPGLQLTVSTFLDKNHFYTMDFHFSMGTLSASQGTVETHLNFKTDLTLFGVSVRYALSHLYRKPSSLSPYVGMGVEYFNFNSKGDLKDAEGRPYFYASDGTIRDPHGNITARDYVYESDLRSLDLYGRGDFPEYGFAIPLEIGVEAFLTRRVSVRMGTSIHLTTTDMIDNIDRHSDGLATNRRNDYFTYTYLSLHLDLFSDPEYKKEKQMFAELPPDDVYSGDEDQDWVLDLHDECPHTPAGVKVDTLGCPLDRDHDGVPDYLDQEPHTRRGAVVDDEGRQVPDTTGLSILSKQGAPAGDIGYYLSPGGQQGKKTGNNLPAKFRQVDLNHDGEISFDELLKMIDDYFDYKTLLSMEDIYDLINYYFSQ